MNYSIEKTNIFAIVPAAGSGSRVGSSIPKQYIKLGNKTILEHTLTKLLSIPKIQKIVVVIDKNDQTFSSLEISHHPKIITTFGGKNRSDSVLCGLNLIDDDSWALVHDAARPCVFADDVICLINTVLQNKQGAILATRVTDTIKKTESTQSNLIKETINRELLWAAATPQMFNTGLLKSGLLAALKNGAAITDEASAIEYMGGSPLLVECRRDNIKVTRQEDLALVRFYLTEQGYLSSN